MFSVSLSSSFCISEEDLTGEEEDIPSFRGEGHMHTHTSLNNNKTNMEICFVFLSVCVCVSVCTSANDNIVIC